MNKEKGKNKKTIILVIILLVLIFIGYKFFWNTDSAASDETAVIDNEVVLKFVAMLEEIKALKLDVSFFASPIFTSLKDYTVEISPQPVGRKNPFAPIGVGDSGL